MSSRKPSDSREAERRPTLPPIRELFGSELSRGVPGGQQRRDSSSAQHPPAGQGAHAQHGPHAPAGQQPYPYSVPPPQSTQRQPVPGQASAPMYAPQSTIATGKFPYGASQQYHQSVPMAGSSSMGTVGELPAGDRASKYECSYCGKGFTRPSSLKIHINTHTGEKPFACPYEGCGRRFSVQSNMRRHARVHERGSQPGPDEDSQEDEEEPAESSAGKSGR